MKGENKIFKATLFVLFSLALAGSTAAQSQITTNPGFIDAGNISRGEEIEMTFFVSVDAEENVTLDVELRDPIASRLWGEDIPIQEQQYSQEDIGEWVSYPDQITVDPSTEVERDFGSGNEELVVGLDIPEDAEPGYHAGMLRLNPTATAGGEGYGAGTVTTSIPEFMFRVPGNARRGLDLTNLEAIRTGEQEVQLLTTFENTGTVTIESTGGELEVVEGESISAGTVDIGGFEVGPGETQQVEATWSGEDGGEYALEGTVDYITGQAFVGAPTAQFAITGAIEEAVEVQPDEDETESGGDSTPMWIVVMVLVVIGAILYSMEIDPFWIVVILGVLGLTAAVVFTGLPNWIVAIIAAGIGILVYI